MGIQNKPELAGHRLQSLKRTRVLSVLQGRKGESDYVWALDNGRQAKKKPKCDTLQSLVLSLASPVISVVMINTVPEEEDPRVEPSPKRKELVNKDIKKVSWTWLLSAREDQNKT